MLAKQEAPLLLLGLAWLRVQWLAVFISPLCCRTADARIIATCSSKLWIDNMNMIVTGAFQWLKSDDMSHSTCCTCLTSLMAPGSTAHRGKLQQQPFGMLQHGLMVH